MPLTNAEAGRLLPEVIDTPENRQALIDAGANARDVIKGLSELGKASRTLITHENFQALIATGANANGIASGLAKINLVNRYLISGRNLRALINDGNNTNSVGDSLTILNQANPDLISQTNFHYLIRAIANAEDVSYALNAMRQANPNLITEYNLAAIVDARANARNVAQDIINQGIINREATDPEPLNLIDIAAIPEAPSGTLNQQIIDAARVAGVFIPEIPDEFNCTITMEIMDQPARNVGFKTPNRCEYTTLLQIAENQRKDPWTREPMNPADVRVDKELKVCIQAFVWPILEQLREQDGHENDFPEFERPDDTPRAGPAGP